MLSLHPNEGKNMQKIKFVDLQHKLFGFRVSFQSFEWWMCIQSTPMLEWVWVQNPWRYPHWVIQERWENTKRIIEVEQAILIYSNAQNKKKEKEIKEKKRKRVRVIVWTLWQYPRWVMRERWGNTKRESHQKLLCLLQCSEKSTSIQKDLSNGIHAE